MTGPNLHRHVAVYKGYIAGGAASYLLLSTASLLLFIAWLFGFGLGGWLFAVVVAAVLVLLSGLRRRVVVRMDLYTVRIRNVLLPGAGKRVPVRSIHAIRIIRSTPHTAGFLRWLPGARRSILLRSGPALEVELSTGATHVLGLDEPFEASRMLRRFHAETTGRDLPEDVLDDEEAFYLWRRNRAGRGRGPVPKPRTQAKAGAKQAGAKQTAAKQNAAKQANAKQAAARQNAAKAHAVRQAATRANAARQAQQRRR